MLVTQGPTLPTWTLEQSMLTGFVLDGLATGCLRTVRAQAGRIVAVERSP